MLFERSCINRTLLPNSRELETRPIPLRSPPMTLRLPLIVALGAGLFVRGGDTNPDAELAQAEKTLRAAGIGVAGPEVVQFFRDRSVSEDDTKRLMAAVQRLGDKDYKTREQA